MRVNALTGASGAGAALACWLSRPGHRLIVVNRLPVPAPRRSPGLIVLDGAQAIAPRRPWAWAHSAAAGEEQVEQADGG
ncbi:hypothetical protein [Actinomadura violacea]|uniref:Uncharacterized protein n=1 Tax=Actinomadura violacea TaxID=2819934 RepID=A0ABS3RQW1_9ACTN|nr:hypothetical protein [Actinomadura violacea]MBO2458693.1 hypothetical protein [Actinomadura violacea]